MADNKRWFKVWNSILTDPTFLSLPLERLGQWMILGSLMSLHGNKGQLTTPKKSLCSLLRCHNGDLENTISALPNVTLRRLESDNDNIVVIMKNWSKYQRDSTSYQRLKKWRAKQNDNGVRGEETKNKNKTKKRKRNNILSDEDFKCKMSPKTDTMTEGFNIFYKNYPKKKAKANALKAWLQLKPDDTLLKEILKALELQKDSEDWQKQDGKYIPYPSSWLNQKRWEDEIKSDGIHYEKYCIYDKNIKDRKVCYFDCKECDLYKKGKL